MACGGGEQILVYAPLETGGGCGPVAMATPEPTAITPAAITAAATATDTDTLAATAPPDATAAEATTADEAAAALFAAFTAALTAMLCMTCILSAQTCRIKRCLSIEEWKIQHLTVVKFYLLFSFHLRRVVSQFTSSS